MHRVKTPRVLAPVNLKRLYRSIRGPLILLLLVSLLMLLLPRLLVFWYAQPRLFTFENVPPKPAAVVFGAGLAANGNLTPELSDRVSTAVNLYMAGKVSKLLMSGDNRFVDHNEPGAMRRFAMRLGVPDGAIVQDYAGRHTYDTCYRAGFIFGLHDVILVTQQYHLWRALYICNMLGLDAVGIPADRPGAPYLYGNLREIPATLTALWQVHFSHPLPVLGNQEPIFPVSAP